MKMKGLIICSTIILTFRYQPQENLDKMDGFWQNVNEQSIIEYFDGNVYLSFSYSEKEKRFSGGKYPSRIGFYNRCDLPHIDSLNSSGIYYFSIDEEEINDDGSVDDYDCLELSFSFEDGTEYLNIYRSSRQQLSTYKKLDTLPEKLKEYLKVEHPSIYNEYGN